MSSEVKITPETFIDRSTERTIFSSMFSPNADTPLRVMQISVPSGGGKSGLLRVFFEFCRRGQVNARPVLVDFHTLRDDVTALDVAVRVKEALERGAPKAFEEFGKIYDDYRVRRRQRFFPEQVDNVTVNMTISKTTNSTATGYKKEPGQVRPFTDAELEVAQTQCLSVFGEELRALLASMDVLIIVDAWEKSPSTVQRWLREQFVRDGIAAIQGGPAQARLRIVVAGQPLSDQQPRGLDESEFLDWFPGLIEYQSAVSVHGSLSRFADEDVHEFMALYGMCQDHPDFATVFPVVRHLAEQGRLETARQLVGSYTSGGNP